MTTTTAAHTDLAGVIQRVDARWARRQGDEPNSPEYLKLITDAVRPLLGQPVAVPADDGEVQQLRDDKQRLGDLVAELRTTADTRGKVIDRQKREIDEARADRDTAQAQLRDRPADGSVRQKLIAAATDVTVREKLAAAAADVERFAGENRTLTERLAAAERDLAAANRTLDEIADEQNARPAAHRHQFEVDLSTGEHRPCECKQPWIRDLLEEDEPVVPDVEPLDALFGRIRSEAVEAGWTA